MIPNVQKRKYLEKILRDRFSKIKRSELLKNDYGNFILSVSCDVFLKEKMLHVYENLYCEASNFKKYFGNLTFKQAYVTTYFEGCSPRCPFCGKLLEVYEKENVEDQEYKKLNGCYPKYKYVIADIEHIFPKSLFPQFALHPNNMVPCCKECNQNIKKDNFFTTDPMNKFLEVIEDLKLDINNLHPLELWKFYTLSYNDEKFDVQINKSYKAITKEFLSFYGIEERIKIMASHSFNILFNIIRHSDIRSPESLERLLENIASSNWHEVNDGYSLNNSPQICQEFIENILYDECKLMALWDEVKSSELHFL